MDYSKYKLTPLEGKIMWEISEAGSDEIVTLVATLHSYNLIETDRLLETFTEALKRLYRWKLIRIAKCQIIDGRCVWVSLSDTDRAEVIVHLANCPWESWHLDHDFGPCENVEICLNE